IVLDPKTISELELTPTGYEVELMLADRRKVKARLFVAEAEVEGRKGPVFVAELDVPTPLLGIFALETLGLRPNPLTGKLEVVGPRRGLSALELQPPIISSSILSNHKMERWLRMLI
ncbi:MAG: hypothetical protein QXE61_08570, partial [Nitrososphaerota archaeon]